jgi:predicted ATP-grasp superfamily ATP-dependent carboligase
LSTTLDGADIASRLAYQPATGATAPHAAPEAAATTHARPAKALLLAATYALPYQVLRCARKVAGEVIVLGDLGSQALVLSRYCNRFIRSHRTITGQDDDGLVLEINALIRQHGISLILPGDAPSTRALIACRNRLHAPCYPLPDIGQFDALNDKWRFAQLCADLGLPHPRTRLFASAAAIEADIAAATAGEAQGWVLKPLGLSGNQGIVRLNGQNAAQILANINYEPVLMQDFVPGQDLSATMFCRAGHIEAFAAHAMHRRIYSVVENAAACAAMQRLAHSLNLTGVFNFDFRLSPDGAMHILECNPRFSFRIALAMLAGLNFIDAGLRPAGNGPALTVPPGTQVRVPEALILSPKLWPKLNRRDIRTAAHMLADPIPLLFDQLAWPA